MGCWDIQKSDASLEEDSRPWWVGVKAMVMGLYLREGLAPEVPMHSQRNLVTRLCLLHILKIPFVKVMRLACTTDVSTALRLTLIDVLPLSVPHLLRTALCNQCD